MNVLSEDELIIALEKALPEVAEDHQLASTVWNPHEYVPWDDGRNFAFMGGDDWDPSQQTLSDETAAGLLALLLTKDNLPSYHRILAKYFPAFSDWRQLVGVWTAEDNRHAVVLRDYLVVRRAIDPVDAEERRRVHVTAGYRQNEAQVDELKPLDVLALMAVHEAQSVKFIEKMQASVTDDILAQILHKVAGDDETSSRTFVNLLGAGLVADQDTAVIALDKALARGLDEPIGFDIVDFDEQRALIADYQDESTIDAIAASIVDQLKLESVDGLNDEAAAAKARILARAGR
ncbi:acyl-ACP desaturase [Gordonia aichiensis]|uniref:Acyl-[acyl-carrier-protein] desaturase DesA n=1 Tax=Gordonia aichiensis NBRC 108223 TaxID=1220583 RepID=L7KM92_9ACTN|nr:acyl-ACP desaturase [Gordonia aichiensis]GAC49067.1 acyl-[acyl-carrier-protein] desaturase DesA [Gordonia aichiensis NBRC 108223]